MTRSPITVAVSLIVLAFDSICNTLVFSSVTIGNIFHWQCSLGIVATTLGQFAFLVATGSRIYRISKVYNNYLKYLDTQKVELQKTDGMERNESTDSSLK